MNSINDIYYNQSNISPFKWGKSGWIFLNSIALTYKPEFKEKYKILLEQLGYILPCENCGANLRKNISNLDNALESKESFMLFLLNLRNQINIDNKLPLKTMQDNIDEIYYPDYNYCYITISVMILIILILLYIVLQNTL